MLHGTPADEVWLSVKRVINGEEKRYVERMDTLAMGANWTDAHMLVYADAAKVFEFTTPTTVLTGLGHLEGKEYIILTDGTVHPKKTVDDGQITLDYPAKKIVVGLQYTSLLQPMKQEVPMQDGTAQGRRFKLHGVTLRVDHSLGGEVAGMTRTSRCPGSARSCR